MILTALKLKRGKKEGCFKGLKMKEDMCKVIKCQLRGCFWANARCDLCSVLRQIAIILVV